MKLFLLLIACLLVCRTSFAQNSDKTVSKVDSSKLKATPPKVNQLKEVSIQAKKPFIEHRADKTVINVEQNIVAAGGTALEVLEKAPGVTIDRQNEQIKLNNKSGITVLIDGKTNFLSGADITTLLSNMSSEQIASIELITNPSSKYDASGNAGIINIKLKRNKSFGTNGQLSLNTGQGIMPEGPSDLYRVGLQLTLNHRVNKWNVYGTGAFNRKVGFNNINVLRNTVTSSLTSSFNQNFDRTTTGVAYMGKVGADYYASEKTVFGLMIDANAIINELSNYSRTFINEIRPAASTTTSVNQQAFSTSPIGNVTANFNIRHDFNKEGSNLTFDADYVGFNNKKDENFDAQYVDHANVLTRTTALTNRIDAKIDVYGAKSDFTYSISKTLKLETGIKSSYVVTHNNFTSSDIFNSNNFIYKENINAIYTSIAKDWSKWQIQLGLRAEHTHSNGHSVTSQKEVDRNYVSLFPTLFINQAIAKNQNIRYSYSRRVDRPNYQQLNPFVFYMDPFALDEGNPYLKPQFTHNFEMGYSFKEASLSLTYSDTRDLITQISQQNDSTRIISVIRKNLGRAQNYSANLYVPISVAKFWKMQNNVSLYFNKFDDNNLEGAAFTANKLAYNLNSSQSFTLPKDFALEVSCWLNSPRVNGVEETTITQWALNAGLQKSVWNKKLKIRLGMDDIFLTNRWEGKLQYQNINMRVVNKYLSRRASFTVNYNFGNQNVKSARNRNTATEDLKNRAN